MATARSTTVVFTKVHAFVLLLRENGVRLATVEFEDSLASLTLLDEAAFIDRDSLHAVLSTTLLKSVVDQPVFDRLFELHFRFRTDVDPVFGQSFEDALRAEGISVDDADIAALRFAAGDTPLGSALSSGNGDAVLDVFRALTDDTDMTGLRTPLQVPYFAERLLRRAHVDRVITSWREAVGVTPASLVLRAAIDVRVLALRRLAQRLVREDLEKRHLAMTGGDDARRRPFRALSAADKVKLTESLRRWCERLKSTHRRRARVSRTGRLDIKRTLRNSMSTDGVPVRISFRRRRKERPDLVVLCDVSDSVAQASGFMLTLVYSLVEVTKRVRAFAFVDRPGEVTELFRNHAVDDAVTRVLEGDVVSVFANSDYGRALREFAAMELDGLTRKTTVVILGDGRTNQRDPETWVLDEIRRRAKQVVWFCPEDRRLWGIGDSQMPAYARRADRVEVIECVADLEHAVARLIL